MNTRWIAMLATLALGTASSGQVLNPIPALATEPTVSAASTKGVTSPAREDPRPQHRATGESDRLETIALTNTLVAQAEVSAPLPPDEQRPRTAPAAGTDRRLGPASDRQFGPPRRNPRNRFPADGPIPDLRSARVLTFIPSNAGGQRGIAVGVLAPQTARYPDGAPVVIHVPGGVDMGATEGRPEYAGLGFVEIRFAFPGGGRGEGTSGGTYDHRGPNCIRALADVIRFATGRLKDNQGRSIAELLPNTRVLTKNVGILGSSHGGNACGLVMATHGEEFPDLAFYASMESPYGEGNVNIELGGREQGVNLAYNPITGVLDMSKLAWSGDLPPGPPRRWRGTGSTLKGALFFDLDGDGRFSESKDSPANVFVQDLGQGPKAWYSPRLIREAETRTLYGAKRPDHIPTLAESTEYWRWCDAAGSIAAAVGKCKNLAVIVYANERDHVQVAPDHPHILVQAEGFRAAGVWFIRLNPDRSYVEQIVRSGGPGIRRTGLRFPDNDAGKAWNRQNIREGLEPEALPITPYMQAAVSELADRTQTRQWAANLDAVLVPNAPWRAFPEPVGEGESPQTPRPIPPDRSRAERSGPHTPDQAALSRRVAPDAGSASAPLLFCIGMHIEPFGAEPSRLAGSAVSEQPRGRVGPQPRPDYNNRPFFDHQVADIRRVARIIEQNGGKLTFQAQTPFTRIATESDLPLLGELERKGHEVALHFHEDAHLGRGSERLPVATWVAVMKEEIEWLKKAGATRVRYWSGGNLFPGVLEAAAQAGLEVMSDHKNPRRQETDLRLLGVNPWRPAGGPSESDVSAFTRHDAGGKIIYLPDGLFSRVDHAGMRRSPEAGGDWRYFDFLTESLEQSLRAARSDRVNVFHITVHGGEFRGNPDKPFAVIEAWLRDVVTPLVKAGKVRWATFSEMADAFKSWKKANPGVSPRPSDSRSERSAAATPATSPSQGYITFVVNVHDWGRAGKSGDTISRLIDLFTRHGVRGDFYLTAPVVEAYAQSRPDVLDRLQTSGMTISYHYRPPFPAYAGFDGSLRDLDDASLRATLRDYETFRLDLKTGGLQRDRPGGYAYVKQVLGVAPVAVSAMGNPRAKSVLLDIYREQGAKMTMEYHESGTKPDQPFAWRQGLLIRPSDFSITRWTAPGENRESFWWTRQDTPQSAAFNPTMRLQSQLAAWTHPRAPLITVLIHENDFYVRGGPSWNAIYLSRDGRSPRTPPYDVNAPDQAEPRTAENQAAIWRAYEELVAYAARNLRVVTSADVVKMAESAKKPG